MLPISLPILQYNNAHSEILLGCVIGRHCRCDSFGEYHAAVPSPTHLSKPVSRTAPFPQQLIRYTFWYSIWSLFTQLSYTTQINWSRMLRWHHVSLCHTVSRDHLVTTRLPCRGYTQWPGKEHMNQLPLYTLYNGLYLKQKFLSINKFRRFYFHTVGVPINASWLHDLILKSLIFVGVMLFKNKTPSKITHYMVLLLPSIILYQSVWWEQPQDMIRLEGREQHR